MRLLHLEARDGEYESRFEQVTGLWPLLLPHRPELLAAHAHARLNRALTRNRDANLFVDLAAQIAKREGRTLTLPEEFLSLRVGRSGTGLAAGCRRVPNG
jgi:hypothetical protein